MNSAETLTTNWGAGLSLVAPVRLLLLSVVNPPTCLEPKGEGKPEVPGRPANDATSKEASHGKVL